MELEQIGREGAAAWRGTTEQTEHLPAALMRLAREQPRKVALIELGDGERETGRFDYESLVENALAVAGKLVDRGCVGRPVVIGCRPGADYAIAVLACMFAGAIAVPMPEYQPSRPSPRWVTVMAKVRPVLVISTARTASAMSKLDETPWLPIETAREHSSRFEPAGDTGDAIAFVQFTSGSTGSPKGAIISQRALTATRGMIRSAFAHHPGWTCVTWLPPWHDMGLVGGMLQPLGEGMTVVALPPLSVIQRPIRWLRAISSYQAQVSGGPMLGYTSCTERISAADRATLDLSSWQLAYCGAEPVRGEALRSFARAFEPAGFSKQALYPCYGLAEATLFVAGPPAGSGLTQVTLDPSHLEPGMSVTDDPSGRRLVSCGRAWDKGSLRIVLPGGTEELPDGTVGEILVSGPHLASGFWGDDASDEFIDIAGVRTLRTGDLGLCRDGALYVVGRIKEVLIVHGVKHHASDVDEQALTSHVALHGRAAAVFATMDGEEEQALMAVEVARSDLTRAAEIGNAIAAAVLRRCGLRLAKIIVLRPGSLPRTTSGKIERFRCRALYEQGCWRADVLALGAGEPVEVMAG